jgi:hypothetical protein
LTRVSTASGPGEQLGGRIYICDGLVRIPLADGGCPAERVAQNRQITFAQTAIFGRQASSRTDRNGIYSVVLFPGHYRVSIEGCRRYVVQPTVADNLDLRVAKGANDERGMPSLYWVIDSGGNCYQNPPLGL